jgi:DNA-binding XRE family transcriptional regulator
MKHRSKYHPLYEHLRASGADALTLTFAQVEMLMGESMPASARARRGWWSNRAAGSPQSAAWTEAGYRVEDVDLQGEHVTFRKPGLYEVRRRGDMVLWDGDLVKALRLHMGLNQAELAEELGVRQQTISEWETGAYEPRRAMCKYLAKVAEEAGFSYGENE